MYKVFIVDDEENTRTGLRELFDWKKWGIEVIGEASDGSTALEPILALKPDLVLSDIKMPMMDGVALANLIKEKEPEIKLIFISGYDDTEYLKSALKLDAIDYIFKPVDFGELEIVIKKVLNIMDVESSARKLREDMDLKLTKSMPLLRDKFFVTLIKNAFVDGEQMEKQARFLELDMPQKGQYCIMVVAIDDYLMMLEKITERDRQLLSFGIINILQELTDLHVGGYVFENGMGEYVAVLNMKDISSNEKLYVFANDIRKKLLKYMEISITVGIGNSVDRIEDIPHSYRMASNALNHKLYLGKNHVIAIDSIDNKPNETFQFDFDKWEYVTSLLTAADKAKMGEYVEKLFEEMTRTKNINKNFYHNICVQLVVLAERLLLKLEIRIENDSLQAYHIMQTLYRLETLEDMKQCILDYYRKVCDVIHQKRENKSTNVIESIKKIINKRFAENWTIQDLAKEVYLTPTYICLLFRQEMEMTINDYLTKVRIDEAKKMLEDPQNKVYDISYAVGYANPSYFSLQFKKLTGMGPREYRDKML